jgi:hypothetical protein
VEREWLQTYDTLVRRRQFRCRVIARTLRHPSMVDAVVAVLARRPGFARPFVGRSPMSFFVHGIGTASPPFRISQAASVALASEYGSTSDEQRRQLKALYRHDQGAVAAQCGARYR